MPMNRREFLAASVAGAVTLTEGRSLFGASVDRIEATIDATKIGEPITPLIFGGYMEPATTRVWAEMLFDRKFAQPITNKVSSPENAFFRRFMGEPWKPAGSEAPVEMDTAEPFVGEHSPRFDLTGSGPKGIQQGGLRLKQNKEYTGRIYLKGDSAAKVIARLVWGSGPGDSQAIHFPTLSAKYQNLPLKFTPSSDAEDARLEIVGTGSGTYHIGTLSLMPADNLKGFHAGMIKLYKEAGFRMAKWPGGNFVSAYDWYDGIGDRDKRPPRPQVMWGDRIEPNDVGIHEFIDFCRLLDAEPYVAVNTGFGEARVAAEEVEYCNGSVDTPLGKLRAKNGHPEPFNVRLWCIGNEMYGWWQFGFMSLNQYWVKHNMFVDAMKKVDPRIRVTSAGATACERSWCDAENDQFAGPDLWRPPVTEKLPYAFGSTHDWDGWMLDKCIDRIDHISEHTYCYPDFAFDAQKQHFVPANDALQFRARRGANRIGAAFDAWEKYLDKIPALREKNMKFIFDEWGCRYRSIDGSRGFRRPTGMVTPLAYALFLHEMFRHSGMVAASCPTGGLFTVLVDHTGEASGYSAEGLVMKIYGTHLAGTLPVALTGNSPQQPMAGTPFVDMGLILTGSPTYPLDVVAAISSDKKKFILSVVNPTESARDLTQHLSGVKLAATGTLWQIAPAFLDAFNEPDKQPAVVITETPQGVLRDSVSVPPISISVYEYGVDNA
jgi:alpha-N-arabinofuranosidase